MEHQEPDHAEDAAAKFQEEFCPADPSETGVLVDSSDLSIEELVTIYKAAEILHSQGNEAFLNCLIVNRDHLNLPPLVRVNPLWVDVRRQRRLQICNLLYGWYWETSEAFEEKLQEIVKGGDQQLLEDVHQVEDALKLCWCSPVTLVEDSSTILIEQEAG